MPELMKLSLEDLMNLEVSLASRTGKKLSDVPAAIYVITQEDIRRSGALTIMDLLRMVPGFQVAQLDSTLWAISSRGFNDRFSNKLLIQIDGRSVYTTIFSGVHWDRHDLMLEDIDRIEVIRGPGASLWGANAVNGVINIVTKSAKDTQGGLVSAGHGTEENDFEAFRYGGKIGKNASYRVYGKHFDREEIDRSSPDWTGWYGYRSGFRVDWDLSKKDLVTIQGDVFENKVEKYNESHVSNPGVNILGRWTHVFSSTSETVFQTYYDRTGEISKSGAYSMTREIVETFDIDFQHRFRLFEYQEIVWGLGARFIKDELTQHDSYSFNPVSDDSYRYSGFVQDEITIVRDMLKVILGVKLEYNDYTAYETQPNARIVWTPNSKNTIWAAVSRAVRTPSRAERTIKLYHGTSAIIYGTPNFDSETLIAYEVGYRVQPTKKIIFDIAAFCNVYDNLLTLEQGSLIFENGNPYMSIYPMNKMHGEAYGVEMAADWRPLKWWQLKASYAYLQMQLHKDTDSTDTSFEAAERKSPRNTFSLRSIMDIAKDVEFDTGLYYVDNLSTIGIRNYTYYNARIGWKPEKNLDMSLIMLNLFNDHKEFYQTPLFEAAPKEIRDKIYLKVTWQF